MEVFGHLERFLSETLYPYRLPLTAGAVLLAVAALWLAQRRRWTGRAVSLAASRPVASAVLGVGILAAILPAGYYLLSPLWTRSTLVEDSPLAAATLAPSVEPVSRERAGASPVPTEGAREVVFQPRTVLEGQWQGADDFHFAGGQALVIEVEPGRYVLRVEDFSVRNGPDLFVYLSPDPAGYVDGAVNLGELKATDGAFNYDIPPGVDVETMRSAVVWCRQFAVLFGTAALQ